MLHEAMMRHGMLPPSVSSAPMLQRAIVRYLLAEGPPAAPDYGDGSPHGLAYFLRRAYMPCDMALVRARMHLTSTQSLEFVALGFGPLDSVAVDRQWVAQVSAHWPRLSAMPVEMRGGRGR